MVMLKNIFQRYTEFRTLGSPELLSFLVFALARVHECDRLVSYPYINPDKWLSDRS
ncbi:hypothetical protein AGABI2DRAFT_194664 [Agaricus bisporus var. bisporus H97]|uniref:hypothetical protein n=1 Tax=Agaricus bisporus var. bisporus (strain H97 / ATCC MYA-4626 / FGSC 10389) TaxID=936046 RepID=UPI00029F7E63|nr:hypothetical protein AGABI2DRAFT_194664 [Agaricus bisporus var. bisporus H97]EKV44755.1 hypothetical protein AGABI2DRAFT_194664 [Agaricus bisporus var. bisporus H97]